MILKNTFGDVLKLSFIGGVMYGLLMGIVGGSVNVGIATGIFFWWGFSLLIYLFAKGIEKRVQPLREEISAKRKIICEGGTTVNGIGGWMFLTEDAVEFYPHKANFGGNAFYIALDEIVEVTVKGKLIIKKRDYTYELAAVKPHVWKDYIEKML